MMANLIDKIFGFTSPSGTTYEGSGLQNLKAGVEAAAIAVPITKATELPSVLSKAVTAAKGAVTAVVKSVSNVVKANPIKSVAIGSVAAGYVANNPKQAAKDITIGTNKLIGDLYNFGGNISELRSDPSLSNVKKVYSENPVIATAGTLGIFGTAGVIASRAINAADNIIPDKEIKTEVNKPSALALPKESETKGQVLSTNSNDIPMTQERQIIGKTKTTGVTRYKHKKSNRISNFTNKIQIINFPRIHNEAY